MEFEMHVSRIKRTFGGMEMSGHSDTLLSEKNREDRVFKIFNPRPVPVNTREVVAVNLYN